MGNTQSELKSNFCHDYNNGVDIEQLERKITILSSSCNSVFARPVDFENLSEAKLMRANYFEKIRAEKISANVSLMWGQHHERRF